MTSTISSSRDWTSTVIRCLNFAASGNRSPVATRLARSISSGGRTHAQCCSAPAAAENPRFCGLMLGLIEPDVRARSRSTVKSYGDGRQFRVTTADWATSCRMAGCSRISPPPATSPCSPATSASLPLDRRTHRQLADLTRFPRDGLTTAIPPNSPAANAQRVGLMRALMLDPAVLLLDEPLGALDPLVRASCRTTSAAIFRELGKTVVLVTHDLGRSGSFRRRGRADARRPRRPARPARGVG